MKRFHSEQYCQLLSNQGYWPVKCFTGLLLLAGLLGAGGTGVSWSLIYNLWRRQCSNIQFMEKAMAPHSSTLAWKIPWTEEPGGLQSMGSLRVGHD